MVSYGSLLQAGGSLKILNSKNVEYLSLSGSLAFDPLIATIRLREHLSTLQSLHLQRLLTVFKRYIQIDSDFLFEEQT